MGGKLENKGEEWLKSHYRGVKFEGLLSYSKQAKMRAVESPDQDLGLSLPSQNPQEGNGVATEAV